MNLEDASRLTDEPAPLPLVLFQCLRHFVHLDESNAAIHCAPVRYSPIAFRLAEHLATVGMQWLEDPFVAAVLAHVGQYEEDKGR